MHSETRQLPSQMLAYLKKLYRARGLRLSDVAEMIEVSERSVIRYLNGHGVTLDVLDSLCVAAGVTILELAELANGDDQMQVFTNDAQEEALADDPIMSITFYLLTLNWSTRRIAQEFDLTDVELNKILLRLDRLGLITLYCENRLKVRATLRTPANSSPRLKAQVLAGAKAQLDETDLSSASTLWAATMVRLGPDSFQRVRGRLQSFVDEIVELSKHDNDLLGEQVQWFGVSALLSPQKGVERLKASARLKDVS